MGSDSQLPRISGGFEASDIHTLKLSFLLCKSGRVIVKVSK